ncbi:flagellar filament capping protein FliD [Gracilibacillus xinjiangensis]|uniref:Flagellar hook-associated protein 2 n=1 Tax=Gracilibacillus xinjiangensis TaxID=1193282 RepID=A0ABV8X056_9BACI
MSAMRISGFASGMDIETMVKDLMKAESYPLQTMQQEKQLLEWKRDDYRSINSLLLDFRNTLSNMRLTTSYRSRETSSTDESKVTASASSAASQTSFSITEVKQLASAATLINEGGISGTEKIDASKSLLSQNANLGTNINWNQGAIETKDVTVQADGEIIQLEGTNIDTEAMNIQLNGKGYEVVTGVTQADLADNQVLFDATNNSLTFAEGVVKKGDKFSAEYAHEGTNQDSKILTAETSTFQLSGRSIDVNSFSLTIDGTTNYTIDAASANGTQYNLVDGSNTVVGTINTSSGRISFSEAKPKGTEITADYQQNYSSFALGAHTENGQTYRNFIMTGNESLNQVISKVNNSKVGVSMMYDSYTDQVTMSRKDTGEFNDSGNEIITSFSSGNNAFINDVLKFRNGTESGGDNAIFSINGITDTERSSNNFQIDGVTFNLKQKFTPAEGPVTVSVSNNSEDVYENIKEFVEKYNTLIEAINSKVNEEYYRDYKPLTDDQKQSLSDTQQEEWTNLAKSGLLRSDQILRDTLSKMRTDFYSPVNNSGSSVFNQLAQIGITTTKDYMQGGKLEINEGKLKEAIQEDPDAVEKLFISPSNEYGEQGIVNRLYDSVNSSMDRIYERAGRTSYSNEQFTIGKNLSNLENKIRRFEDRLSQIEDRYWSQFTAMEQAISKYNSQSSYLMQMFSGGQ